MRCVPDLSLPARVPPAMPAILPDPALVAQRKPQPAESLAPETIAWLASLPFTVRPRELPIHFVRIANALGRTWTDPLRCTRYLDDLVLDRRGNRRGFPLDIALEIVSIKNYFETVVNPMPQSVWDEVAARGKKRG